MAMLIRDMTAHYLNVHESYFTRKVKTNTTLIHLVKEKKKKFGQHLS